MSLRSNQDTQLYNCLQDAMEQSIKIIETKYKSITGSLSAADIIDKFYKKYPKDHDVKSAYRLSQSLKELNAAISSDEKRSKMFSD
jgi:hypothetical protein